MSSHSSYQSDSAHPIIISWPGVLRKAIFRAAKGGLLACKKRSFIA